MLQSDLSQFHFLEETKVTTLGVLDGSLGEDDAHFEAKSEVLLDVDVEVDEQRKERTNKRTN